MGHFTCNVTEHDKAVLGIHYLADRTVNEVQELIEIWGGYDTLNDLMDNLSLSLGLLSLGYVLDCASHPDWVAGLVELQLPHTEHPPFLSIVLPDDQILSFESVASDQDVLGQILL